MPRTYMFAGPKLHAVFHAATASEHRPPANRPVSFAPLGLPAPFRPMRKDVLVGDFHGAAAPSMLYRSNNTISTRSGAPPLRAMPNARTSMRVLRKPFSIKKERTAKARDKESRRALEVSLPEPSA